MRGRLPDQIGIKLHSKMLDHGARNFSEQRIYIEDRPLDVKLAAVLISRKRFRMARSLSLDPTPPDSD